jgi:hypothetical protein
MIIKSAPDKTGKSKKRKRMERTAFLGKQNQLAGAESQGQIFVLCGLEVVGRQEAESLRLVIKKPRRAAI